MDGKIDLKKRYATLYSAHDEPARVRVPELSVFAVDGSGDPRITEALQARAEALYAASYALKFALKKARGLDWTVMPMEGDWWCENMALWSMEDRRPWIWRLMVVQPEEATEAEALEAIAAARRKKPDNPAMASLRFERRPAHAAMQILHRGPYATEPPTIALLHAFIAREGARMIAEHREVYLGDPRKSAPEKLKTIIRQPIAD